MKSIKTLSLLSLTAVSALFTGGAFAQDSYSPGGYYYGGAGVGRSRSMVDNVMTDKLRAGSIINAKEADTTFKGFVGYQINRNIGVEGGYFNLGKSGFTSTTTMPMSTYNSEMKIDGVYVDAVGTLPFTDKISGLARVGAQYANLRNTAMSTGMTMMPNENTSTKSLNIRYGLGVQYEVNPSLFVRAEADLNRIKHADGHTGNFCNYSVSVVIPFGRTPIKVAAAPVYVAPVYVAPAPAPVVVVTPPPPVVVAPAPAPAPMPVFVPPVRPAKQDRN